jgi:DNA repair protein RecN (Recombination protein N)
MPLTAAVSADPFLIWSASPKAEALTSFGLDRVEFLVATNPKAELRPLTRVASGGELSRIFLSLKTALSADKSAQVLIFDEVDTGIGGLTATKVGAMLKELSERQQVICITHLPQIAALADHHFVVEKESDAEEARTRIRALSREERVEEIARMLGQKEARELAAKMLGGK